MARILQNRIYKICIRPTHRLDGRVPVANGLPIRLISARFISFLAMWKSEWQPWAISSDVCIYVLTTTATERRTPTWLRSRRGARADITGDWLGCFYGARWGFKSQFIKIYHCREMIHCLAWAVAAPQSPATQRPCQWVVICDHGVICMSPSVFL